MEGPDFTGSVLPTRVFVGWKLLLLTGGLQMQLARYVLKAGHQMYSELQLKTNVLEGFLVVKARLRIEVINRL